MSDGGVVMFACALVASVLILIVEAFDDEL